MKYPFVYLLRHEKYSKINIFFSNNIEKLNCTVEIINTKQVNNYYFSNESKWKQISGRIEHDEIISVTTNDNGTTTYKKISQKLDDT